VLQLPIVTLPVYATDNHLSSLPWRFLSVGIVAATCVVFHHSTVYYRHCQDRTWGSLKKFFFCRKPFGDKELRRGRPAGLAL